jgi:rare lipoprotein A
MWVNGRSSTGHGATGAPAKQSCFGMRQTVRFAAIALAAAMLGACSQATLPTRQYAAVTPVQEMWSEAETASPVVKRSRLVRRAALASRKRMALATRKPETRKPAASTRDAAQGLASYYRFHGRRTASGETFSNNELTAAHRTLPFGTRLRVTNVATGQTVTVRVNDRGPFIPGRVVDVSHSAAEALGMTQQGVAKVKLDVVE